MIPFLKEREKERKTTIVASMYSLSFLRPPSFLFLFFLFLHILIAEPYTPKEQILLNCGSSGTATALDDGRQWIGDLNSKFKAPEPSQNQSVTATATVQNSVPSVPYMTARLSRFPFTYSIPVTPGPKFIRLYFYPAPYPGFDRSKDFFDVKAGTFTLLRNFSASLYADYSSRAKSICKEFCLNVEENQQLNITFAPFLGNWNESYSFINGIEIVSIPNYIYYTPPDDPGLGVPFIGQGMKLNIKNDTALEKMYRLNVGGGTISPINDTGMYRLWEDDFRFTESDSIEVSNSSSSLNYSKIPAYTAPDNVYRSARGLIPETDNQTWNLKVDQGFRYLVRLHFCEFDEMVEVNLRRFDIFIDNQTAEVGFDVIESSGGHNIPIYKDYTVAAEKVGETVGYNLSIFLRPSNNSFDAFLNGLEVFKLSDSDGNLAGPNPNPPASTAPAISPVQPSPATNRSSIKKTLLLAVGGSVLGLLIILSLMAFLAIWRLRKRKHRGYYQTLSCCWRMDSSKAQSSRAKASSLPEELCRQFSLADIRAATDNFHESLIIGEGGFGNVYRGKIDDGTTVAIKRLNRESRQGFREFKTEIEMLSQLRHVHLVSLIGYCHEEGEMILVYEFMTNGTLREHLYDTNNDPLAWKKRLEICVGAARGFQYLHTGTEHPIIHRDIKTNNILLDENWTAKVSDFGLSKIGVSNSAVSTIVKGTFGYLDPEYARREQLTEKSDVYSFGVVLLEVLCARKPVDQKYLEEQRSLALWAQKCIKNGTIHQIIDPCLMGKISPECFNKFVEIAERCIRENGNQRPSMNDVMENLGFALELQEAADAEKKASGEILYPEVSFHASKYANTTVGGSELDSDNDVSGFSTFVDLSNPTGISYPSLESDSKTSHGFSESTNSATK